MKRRALLRTVLRSLPAVPWAATAVGTGAGWATRGWLALWLGAPHMAHAGRIVAVRLWPAADYTRITIESDSALVTRTQMVADPPRLAVDIEGIDLVPELKELVGRIRPDDPHIAGLRVGQYAPKVVRLVVDLKQPSTPQVFALPPIAAYNHRLVFDLYPSQAPDPLADLIAQRSAAATPSPTAASTSASPSAPPSAIASPTDAQAPDPLANLLALHEQKQAKSEVATLNKTIANNSINKSDEGQKDLKNSAPSLTPAPPRPSGSGLMEATRSPGADLPLPHPASSTSPATPAAPGSTQRLIVVALDPGHGGEDPGAIGPAGTQEKNVVLDIARKLRERLNATSVNGNPLRAYLTRDADYFVPLHVRVEKARRVQADLMVSLHADAFMTPDPAGGSVYALSTSGASSAAARWMANKENAADVVGGLNVKAKDAAVQRALLDMSTTAQIKDSLQLGSAMLREMSRVGKLHKPQVEQAGFAVLKAPDIPSVLVEAAFISNPQEEARLNDDAFQDRLADALLRGIVRYFQANPPLARNRPT